MQINSVKLALVDCSKYGDTKHNLDDKTNKASMNTAAFSVNKQQQSWIKGLLIALLLVWLCFSLANLFWALLSSPPASNTEPMVVTPGETNTVAAPPVDIASLKSIKLFGDPPAVVPEPKPEVVKVDETAAETKLNLSLSGIFANPNQQQAYAIIIKGADQTLYKVGEDIQGLTNVKLVKVLNDRVILSNRGKNESLLLYPEGEKLTSGSTQHIEDNEEAAEAPTPPVENPVPSAPQTQVRSLSEVIKVSMAREGGKVIGFRVRPGRNREAFSSLGLEANDIVTEVNGVELTSSAVAMEVYRNMNSATEASLKVKRQDQEISVEVSLSALQGL